MLYIIVYAIVPFANQFKPLDVAATQRSHLLLLLLLLLSFSLFTFSYSSFPSANSVLWLWRFKNGPKIPIFSSRSSFISSLSLSSHSPFQFLSFSSADSFILTIFTLFSLFRALFLPSSPPIDFFY